MDPFLAGNVSSKKFTIVFNTFDRMSLRLSFTASVPNPGVKSVPIPLVQTQSQLCDSSASVRFHLSDLMTEGAVVLIASSSQNSFVWFDFVLSEGEKRPEPNNFVS